MKVKSVKDRSLCLGQDFSSTRHLLHTCLVIFMKWILRKMDEASMLVAQYRTDILLSFISDIKLHNRN